MSDGGRGSIRIGKVPENVLERSVLKQIRTKRKEVVDGAGIGKDCAIFTFSGAERVFSCMQEAAVAERREGSGENSLDPSLELCEKNFEKNFQKDSQENFQKDFREDSRKKSQENFQENSQKKSLKFPQGDSQASSLKMTMGELIQKCANNLAAGGSVPVAVAITLLMPAGSEEAQIRALMADAEKKCGELSLQIAGGQTRVMAEAAGPMAVVAGYGYALREEDIPKGAAPGQDVVLSKWIGLQGTALAVKKNRQRLLERYPVYLVEEAAGFDRYLSVLPEAEAALKAGVGAMHDASEGGILGALWELAGREGTGLSIDLRSLPLRQETVEVCECCNINPYELMSGGCLIMTAWDGPGLKAALEAVGIPAAIVGKVTGGNDRILINGDEIRYMDRPKNEEIYRIF